MNEEITTPTEDYARIEAAIHFLEANFRSQPDLDAIAASVHLSKYHFQRLFKRWAGLTPTQFLHYLTLSYAKERLRRSHTVLETTLASGLSSPGRLHDLFITYEAITPGEYKAQGTGLEIHYGWHPTPFGECLLGLTPRGICALYFRTSEPRSAFEAALHADWPHATLVERPDETAPVARRIFEPTRPGDDRSFHLLLKGTNFQIRVWEALLRIPPGDLVTYGDIAHWIGKPTASRAVGAAVGSNLVSYLIPCHRVITSSGAAHQYRWGAARKKAMLAFEAASLDASMSQ